jgi:DNA-binding NarL/FixJ family response regulator
VMADLQGGTMTMRSASAGARRQGPDGTRLVRVVHVDDSPLMQLAIRAVLATMHGFVVAAAAGTVTEAEQLILRTRPDLLICDTDLAGECGISLCRWTRRASPRTASVILSARDDHQLAMTALAAGATGYLLKGTPPEELMSYLRQAACGMQVLDDRLGRSVRSPQEPDRIADFGLSRREREVLEELLHGLGNRAIAKLLCISEDTVKSHVKAIFRKLGARDRGHAIALALGTAAPSEPAGYPGGPVDGLMVPLPRHPHAAGRTGIPAMR